MTAVEIRGIEAGFRELVAQIDEMMVSKRKRPVVQHSPDRLGDLKHLFLAARARPDMQGEVMLGAVLGARAPVADRALAEGDEGIRRCLRRIVIDSDAAEKRGQI